MRVWRDVRLSKEDFCCEQNGLVSGTNKARAAAERVRLTYPDSDEKVIRRCKRRSVPSMDGGNTKVIKGDEIRWFVKNPSCTMTRWWLE